MRSPIRIPMSRVLAPIVTVAALGALAWTTWLDIRSGTQRVEQVMRAQAVSIAGLVTESASHGLESYRRWEDEVAARLLDNARWLARRDRSAPLGTPELAQFARLHRLGRINVFDADGRKVATSRIEAEEALPPRHDPADFIRPILSGRETELRIGFKPARFHGGDRFAVAVARPHGGAIVVNVFADSLQAVLAQIRPEHLLESLRSAEGVRYARIETRDSVLAALVFSGSAPTETAAGAAPVPGAPAVAIERGRGAESVYEVAQAVEWPRVGPVVVRVGLDRAPLDRARADLRLRATSRAFVLLVVMTLATFALMVWQGKRVLAGEAERLREELAARAEEARRSERLAAMGELAAHVAHEIRNPLNTIHMNAQQLARDPTVPADVRIAADDMRDGTRRIEETVRQFLEFARPRRPELEDLALDTCLEPYARSARATFDPVGVRFEAHLAPASATADAAMLGEIVENLLRNARESVPPGGAVTLSCGPAGDGAWIAVEDDGPGVPAELRERVFDLYFTTKPQGTGLGLSLVAQRAGAMGARVRLETPPGGGARFVVHLSPATRTP